ncbi:hypothetical protein E2C01_009426 [Portunus trituberculatus]|uniref:Uncharacterized protein n=1 Tax=Portunus trituberculatus TaxID=210409 RepID=A0A5B7D3I0_PORTR|nr:hypothetical protein [Portunus trituberculatus]
MCTAAPHLLRRIGTTCVDPLGRLFTVYVAAAPLLDHRRRGAFRCLPCICHIASLQPFNSHRDKECPPPRHTAADVFPAKMY